MQEPDEWVAQMESPLPTPNNTKPSKKKPTPRELELEAEGFMALYAQVNGN